MANPVLTLEAANLFCGTEAVDSSVSNHLTLTEIKLPGIDEQYVDHRAGGAPGAIEIDTVIGRLECTFVLVGWNPQVQGLIASWTRQQNIFQAFGVVRDRMNGVALQARAIMVGRLGRADPQNWSRGNVMHTNFAIRGIIRYYLQVGARVCYDWDFYQNRLIVDGADRNEDANFLLYTGAPTPPSQVVT